MLEPKPPSITRQQCNAAKNIVNPKVYIDIAFVIIFRDVTIKTYPNLTTEENILKRFKKMSVIRYSINNILQQYKVFLCSINFGPGYGAILTKDVKATFSDKLGTIGGTFGIFIGVSFLSLYEVLIDMLEILKNKIFKKPTKH